MGNKEIEESIVDALGEKLVEEFEEIGETYPNFVSMFIDMVGIVSQQNSQINSISRALQEIVVEIGKTKESIEQLSTERRFFRDTENYLTDRLDRATFVQTRVPVKKEDLN